MKPSLSSVSPVTHKAFRRGAALLGAASLMLLPLFGTSMASAHDELVDSNPKAGSTVDASKGLLEEVVLTMSDDPIPGEGNQIQVLGPNEHHYEAGCLTVEGRNLKAGVLMGAAGTYNVKWSAVSRDGHPVEGSFQFEYENPVVQAPGYPESPACNQEQEASLLSNLASAASNAPPANSSNNAQAGAAGSAAANNSNSVTPPAAGSDANLVWLTIPVVVIIGGGAVLFFLLRRRQLRPATAGATASSTVGGRPGLSGVSETATAAAAPNISTSGSVDTQATAEATTRRALKDKLSQGMNPSGEGPSGTLPGAPADSNGLPPRP